MVVISITAEFTVWEQGPDQQDFPGDSDSKESACSAGESRYNPWVRKIPWRRDRLLTAVFLPGESHGQRTLVGYSLEGRKELDTTE